MPEMTTDDVPTSDATSMSSSGLDSPGYAPTPTAQKVDVDSAALDVPAYALNVDPQSAWKFGRPHIIATDIVPESFWSLVHVHKLFEYAPTQETFPVPFVSGDIFKPALLEPTLPSTLRHFGPKPSKLSDVVTLTELPGQKTNSSNSHAPSQASSRISLEWPRRHVQGGQQEAGTVNSRDRKDFAAYAYDTALPSS
ncbi:hypothetical protein C8Q74DRAFT_1362225 [Fomes fomentarius]|nr:hypothetical protein C8Q74DRAFT_1362225 [Fomes fomentarius]